MVIRSAYMIHAATTNQNPHGRMRLSTDIRYQRRRDEIDRRWQNHWSFDDTRRTIRAKILLDKNSAFR
jgi:hypothetical protein